MTPFQKQQYWQKHVNAWQSSSLSQAAYCKAQQLSLASFGYWRKRCSAIAAPTMSLPAVIPVLREAPHGGAQLRSPGGWQIMLPELESRDLARLLRQLP